MMLSFKSQIRLLALLMLAVGQPLRAADAEPAAALPAIEFELADEQLNAFGPGIVARDIGEQVKANLREWQFALPDEGPYQQRLQARLGRVVRDRTPVGFSFTLGNSDPRAGDFQKADVLPITCALQDLHTQAVLASRDEDFSAHVYATDNTPVQRMHKLADQISTVCLTVLEQAAVSKNPERVKTQLFKPKWMPDVRVEVREVPATAAGQPGVPAAAAEEAEKQVIIHNQGTPVMLKFGYERQ